MSSDALRYDTFQFAGRKNYPVHVEFGSGEVRSTSGVSFEDYARMHTETHGNRAATIRRNFDRAWAHDDSKVRAVLVRAMEIRAGFRYPRHGTDAERLAVAQKTIQERVCPALKKSLNGMCGRYAMMRKMGTPQSELEQLEKIIKGADTQMRLTARIAAITVGIIYRYFRLGDDSVAVGNALGIEAGHVRKIIHGLENCAGELGFTNRANLPNYRPPNRLSEEERERRARMQKAKRERRALAHREERERLQRAQLENRERAREQFNQLRRERYVLARAKGANREQANRFRKQPNKSARIALLVEAATLRKEGWSYARIAALKKFNYADANGVWLALKRAGLLEMTEPKKGEHKGRLADVESIKRLRDAGHTLEAIATMFGVAYSSVWMCLDRATQK